MKKKLVRQLIEASYKNGALNEKETMKIAGVLTRAQLKTYITGLKNQVKKETIYVDSAVELSKKVKEEIAFQFKSKAIIYRVSPDLLMGIRITDGDNVYGLNVRDRLDEIKQYIAE